MTNVTNASSSNIRQPGKRHISIIAIQFVSSESSDGFKGHLGQSSCIMNSSSANSSCIWIGALPHITLEHIELGNCLSTRTLDTICIIPPEECGENRGSKAEKEWVTLWRVPSSRKRKFTVLFFLSFSLCFGAEGFTSRYLCLSAGMSLILSSAPKHRCEAIKKEHLSG